MSNLAASAVSLNWSDWASIIGWRGNELHKRGAKYLPEQMKGYIYMWYVDVWEMYGVWELYFS